MAAYPNLPIHSAAVQNSELHVSSFIGCYFLSKFQMYAFYYLLTEVLISKTLVPQHFILSLIQQIIRILLHFAVLYK